MFTVVYRDIQLLIRILCKARNMATAFGRQQLNSAPSVTELIEFLTDTESSSPKTLFVGNLDPKVTRAVLYELMIQMGPVHSIKIVPPREGTSKAFAFITFEHASSVRYAMLALNDVSLFRAKLSLNYSGQCKKYPRPDYPPYPPTFFEVPPGFQKIETAVQEKHLASATIPPPHYNTGYYLNSNEEENDEYYQPEVQEPQPSHGYTDNGPQNKRMRTEAPRHDLRYSERFEPYPPPQNPHHGYSPMPAYHSHQFPPRNDYGYQQTPQNSFGNHQLPVAHYSQLYHPPAQNFGTPGAGEFFMQAPAPGNYGSRDRREYRGGDYQQERGWPPR